ncbi:hypothetical protein ACFWY9_23255 [Amycolatopsis sp. NPDC059027]|uniref:hypothetical protein n=1 Tax=unclassified Amycolatopsis TaxID=2618356 RepID=UPI00366ED7D3
MTRNFRRWAGCALTVAILATTAACAEGSYGVGYIIGRRGNSGAFTAPPPPPPSPTRPAPAELPNETHSGKGDATVPISWPSDQPGFVTFECPKCVSNVFVNTDGDEISLVNAIGSYRGTHWINMSLHAHRPTRTLTIRANSAWTVTIADARSLPVAEPGKELSGKAESVLKIPAGVTKAAVVANGDFHFALWVTTDSSSRLVVNQRPPYRNTIPVDGPGYVQVEAAANWTFTAS